ncbi:MAG: ABC transporter substrate-binding protein [Acidobacteriia bacterium]|nr:ABC transporter substrate-binding protein [Terriglobia bacterium]
MNCRITKRWLGLVLLFLSLWWTFSCSRKQPVQDVLENWGPLSKDALVMEGTAGQYGGTLVTAIGQEPRSFNRIVSSDTATADIADRIFADLIHINRETQRPEPSLAKSWEYSPDRRSMTMHLREGILFSDGRPFTADDVIFTFQVIYDPKVNSPQADQLKVNGQPFALKRMGDYEIEFTFAQPAAGIERVFDSIFILPKHKLETAYNAGGFASTWTVTSPPGEIVGLGPFRFSRYTPGQRVELERNPHYWKVDAGNRRLPYLSRLILVIIPNRETQFLNFKSGDLDILNDLRAEDYSVLARGSGSSKVVAKDLGPSLGSELLWFNQNRNISSKTRRPLVNRPKLEWFTNTQFRQAVSYAINRKSLVDLIYQGRATEAFGPLTISNKFWYNPSIKQYPYDVDQAKKLLAAAGFQWATVKGQLQLRDGSQRPVRFSLITNAGNRNREKIGAMVQNDLEKIGIQVDFTPLEFSSLIARIMETFDYDACLLGPTNVDTDPSGQMNLWLSGAPNHQWFPNQKKPATRWEERIDELMLSQSTASSIEQRKKAFDEVQLIVSEQLPFIYLVSRNVLVAAKSRVGNFRPTVLDHHTLWNCEQLYLK